MKRKINKKIVLILFTLIFLTKLFSTLPLIVMEGTLNFPFVLNQLFLSILSAILIDNARQWYQKKKKDGILRKSLWQPILFVTVTVIFIHSIILSL